MQLEGKTRGVRCLVNDLTKARLLAYLQWSLSRRLILAGISNATNNGAGFTWGWLTPAIQELA